jgi:hypothetical protein
VVSTGSSGEICQTDFCARNVTASERSPAQFVLAPANAPSQGSQSARVKNAMEADDDVATFAAVMVKLNGRSR